MAGLAPKRGLAHPWWQIAKCVVAILEDERYADAAERMREVYESNGLPDKILDKGKAGR